jgi:hypothetical protein
MRDWWARKGGCEKLDIVMGSFFLAVLVLAIFAMIWAIL